MKTTIWNLAAVLFVLFSTSVYSEEGKRIDLQLGGVSVHAEKRGDGKPWNESNPLVAVQYVTPGTLWGRDVEYCATAGTIKNSEFGQTVFAGGCVRKAILKGSLGEVSVGAFAGVMTYPSRYNLTRESSDLFPAVLPTASACLKNGMCLEAIIVSKVQKGGSTAVLLMGRFPIKHW